MWAHRKWRVSTNVAHELKTSPKLHFLRAVRGAPPKQIPKSSNAVATGRIRSDVCAKQRATLQTRGPPLPEDFAWLLICAKVVLLDFSVDLSTPSLGSGGPAKVWAPKCEGATGDIAGSLKPSEAA